MLIGMTSIPKILQHVFAIRDAPIVHPKAFDDHDYITYWKQRVNGFIDFVQHYRDSTDCLSNTGLWFSTQSVDLFRCNLPAPYSFFFHDLNFNPEYSLLVTDTSYIDKVVKFTYFDLIYVVNTCNFAVLSGIHYFPYRAHYNLSESLKEAVNDMCINLSTLLKSSPLVTWSGRDSISVKWTKSAIISVFQYFSKNRYLKVT